MIFSLFKLRILVTHCSDIYIESLIPKPKLTGIIFRYLMELTIYKASAIEFHAP